ncbi:alpha/beta hydrolase [Nostoc sp. CHAB 5834]|nr:alpha/beta hydrolase [Nostoc sp. CHAB 5834]
MLFLPRFEGLSVMRFAIFLLIAIVSFANEASAQITPFPANFRTSEIEVDGARLHVRDGGRGPAVVLLHGYTQTGDMWAPLATELARNHRVIVPDLRGLGRSSRPANKYDKATQATDIARLLDKLGIKKADIVGHDIGTMVAYAFAARYPKRTRTLIVMDAPIPGVGPWEDIIREPALWHFSFGGPDVERLVAGRERIYLDRFWNEFAADPNKLTEATRDHYARAYAEPGAMRAGFAQFAAIASDAADNKLAAARGKLNIPVLAIGGEKSFGSDMAVVMRAVATDVTEVVISGAGHWLMEEQPATTISAIQSFIEAN